MKIEIIPGQDDGEVDASLPECQYLRIEIHVDGETEGSLSGYFKPEVRAFIKDALTNYAAAKSA